MSESAWDRYCEYFYWNDELGFGLDVSRVRIERGEVSSLLPAMKQALESMNALEQGAIANPDENRMVGHYWLRTPELAPTEDLRDDVQTVQAAILDFTKGIHGGQIRGSGGPFEHILVIGIGGSSLGPQFVAQALASESDPIRAHFLDNTDPDGIQRTLTALHDVLDRTLTIVISKSGGTPETRNGMLLAQAEYRDAAVPFAKHAVAITQEGSRLDRIAVEEGWLARFPMWDWVGGRTSIMSAVGLLPAALQGIDIRSFLDGASVMDRLTRETVALSNPAALLAMCWHHLGQGKGNKAMVVLPYKDRLELFSRYLQQLVMESLGKERDRKGNVVHQGIVVYGNKGSTDQHAYVQQLRDGRNDFFATLIEVLADRGRSDEVEPGITAGDYLQGFLIGTRQALYENGRDSITITLSDVTAESVGALIALYERAVGLYAELIDINAYHQPGVEAGKKAAADVLALETKLIDLLQSDGKARTAKSLAEAVGRPDDAETAYLILRRLAANPARNIFCDSAGSPDQIRFRGPSQPTQRN